MGRKGACWTFLPHPGKVVLSWLWHRHLRALRAIGFAWSSCKLYLLYSCAPARNEEKENKNEVICVALVCVWKIPGSETQMSWPIWKEDIGAILGICARSVRDLDCLYKALSGTAFPGKEGNPCVAPKWEVRMKTNFWKWQINGLTQENNKHSKNKVMMDKHLRKKKKVCCAFGLRNAVLGSRNAKGFGIEVEMSSQCSTAVKVQMELSNGKIGAASIGRGIFVWDWCGCVWKALQEHREFIGKYLDKPKKLKSVSKKSLKAQFLEFQ